MIVPSDHQAIVDELARLQKEVEALAAPLSEEQLNWQPGPGTRGRSRGGWSIGQCIEHLARTNRIYLPALEAAAARGRSAGRVRRDALRPGWLGRWFVNEMEPPPKRRFKAPLSEMIPSASCAKAPTLAAFREAQGEIGELVRTTSDLDLTGIRFRNPLAKNLPIFNLATGFLILAAHERRHLAQALQVRASAGFPAP